MVRVRENKKVFKLKLLELITSFFYLGKIPKMPGTFASLGVLPLIYLMKFLSFYYYLLIFCALLVLAFFTIRALEAIQKQHDHQQIVVDEVLGMMVASVWVPHQVFYLGMAFILFRFFDIFKPFPISWIDQNVKGSLGVIADDLLAGIFTFFILFVLKSYFL